MAFEASVATRVHGFELYSVEAAVVTRVSEGAYAEATAADNGSFVRVGSDFEAAASEFGENIGPV